MNPEFKPKMVLTMEQKTVALENNQVADTGSVPKLIEEIKKLWVKRTSVSYLKKLSNIMPKCLQLVIKLFVLATPPHDHNPLAATPPHDHTTSLEYPLISP